MDQNDVGVEDDNELLQAMIAGEQGGFVSLYRKYQARVYRFSLQVSGVRQIAEEVTQDTFLALIRNPMNFRPDRGSLLLYLFGIARNLAWKAVRRNRLFSALEDENEASTVYMSDMADELIKQERVLHVRCAILSLPRKYREVLVLCCLQELSYEEAAKILKASIGTVRSRLHRAKLLLLQKLQEAGLRQGIAASSSVIGYEL